MRSEPDVTSHDLDILHQVLSDHEISPKALGAWVNRDVTTISRYLSGERTIPLDVYRAVYERTRDPRLMQLMAGTIPISVTLIIAAPASAHLPPIPPLPEYLPRACAAVRDCAQAVEQIGAIVADRQITVQDGVAVRTFRAAAAAAIRELQTLLAAVRLPDERSHAC
ncbi:MAG: hypothetical protein U1A27_00210 [Phycisphaerae bacterium]